MNPLAAVARLHLDVRTFIVEQSTDLHDRRDRLIRRGGHGRNLQERIDDLAKRYDRYRGRAPAGCFCRRCTVDYPHRP